MLDKDLPALPPGYIIVKKGGRPKKEARDAAVFLARFWRMEVHGETATSAEAWIVKSWEGLGKEASKGIGEGAHVRAAIKRSRARGLNQSILGIFGGACFATEAKKIGGYAAVTEGARSWAWANGMHEAIEMRVTNVRSRTVFVPEPFNPISKALRETFPR